MTNEEFFNRLNTAIDHKTIYPNDAGDYIEVKLPIKPEYIPDLKNFVLTLIGESDQPLEGWNLPGAPANYKFRNEYMKVDNRTITLDHNSGLQVDIDNVAVDILNYQNIKDVLNEIMSGYISGLKYDIINEISGMIPYPISGQHHRRNF